MKEFLESLFSPNGFMPHGHCYLWTPGLVWLHVISDALIVLAYYSIPLALVHFVRRRGDVEYGWMFVCFAVFILACGTTHLLEIWNVWHSDYWLSGGMKALTAAASVPTAILLARLMPAALSLASPAQLQRANAALEQEIQTRRRAEERVRELNAELESRVAARTAELEGQRAELQLILDSVPALIFFKDLDHRLIRVNLELTRLMGMPREKLEGLTNAELGSPEAAQYHRDEEEVIATGQPKRGMIEPLLTSTGVRWLQTDKIPRRDGAGRIVGVIGFAVDITERKRAEEALRESEQRLRLATQAAGIGAFEWNVQTGVNVWTPELEAMYGLKPGEFGHTQAAWEQLIHPEDRAGAAGLVQRAFETFLPEHGEWRAVWRDGSIRWLAGRFQVFKDEAGQPLKLTGVNIDITERKQAEERAAWLASFPEHNPNPILELDATRSVFHYINPAARRLFPDLPDRGLEHPLLAGLQDSVAGLLGGRTAVERRVIAVGEEWFSQTITTSPVSHRLRVYTTDITERKKAELALREKDLLLHATDRRLAEIVHGMTEACFALDAGWRFTFVNDRSEALFHCRREEMLGQSIWEVFPKLIGAPMEAHYRRAMAERVADAFEVFSTVAERWLDVHIFPTGEGVAAFLLDIQDRKMAEVERQKFEKLRLDERNLLRTLIDSMPDVIFTKDLQGRIGISNAAHVRFAGAVTEAELFGKTVFDLYPPELAEVYHRDDMEVIATGRPIFNREEPCVNRDGTDLWLITTKVPLRSQAGEMVGLIGVSRDISDRKRAENEIQRLNTDLEKRVIERTAQLEAANQELESFSYSVSHDLRAPLRAVDGFSQAVLDDYGPLLPDEGRRYLQTIRGGAQQMGMLIDDLLTFSRLSRAPLKKQEVDSGNLVRSVLDDFSVQREGRQIDLRIGKLPACDGDPALLKQVWVNLLSNAFKYSQKREVAVVDIGCEQSPEGDVYFVRDNGTGFDMRYAGKLFGVFQRLHRAEEYEGTGVGLALVQRIIQRHGGRVWADAAVDRGATFYFTLGKESKP